MLGRTGIPLAVMEHRSPKLGQGVDRVTWRLCLWAGGGQEHELQDARCHGLPILVPRVPKLAHLLVRHTQGIFHDFVCHVEHC